MTTRLKKEISCRLFSSLASHLSISASFSRCALSSVSLEPKAGGFSPKSIVVKLHASFALPDMCALGGLNCFNKSLRH